MRKKDKNFNHFLDDDGAFSNNDDYAIHDEREDHSILDKHDNDGAYTGHDERDDEPAVYDVQYEDRTLEERQNGKDPDNNNDDRDDQRDYDGYGRRDDGAYERYRREISSNYPPTRRKIPSVIGKHEHSRKPVWPFILIGGVLFIVLIILVSQIFANSKNENQTAAASTPVVTQTTQSVLSPGASESTEVSEAALTSAAESSAGQSASVEEGTWGTKFADQFTDGDPVKTDNSYKSRDISITVNKISENDITYYVADVYLRNIENFKTAFAGGEYGGGAQKTDEMARDNNAILAVSGDYYSARDEGIVLRNGKLYRDNVFEDVLVMNKDGSMQTYSPGDFNLDKVQDDAYQIWSFGPMLLTDGKAMETFNSKVNPKNPRSAVGYYEPGHYCFVLVDGRQEGYSVGMSLKELSSLFEDLGCSVAYNLDGGQTAEMAFLGELANQPYKGGRDVSDIVYIAETGK